MSSATCLHPLWPQALWDVSGAFARDALLLQFHDHCRRHLGFSPYDCVHGSPLFSWNSGRVRADLQRSKAELDRACAAYVQRGISVDLTFTNVLLTEKDMSNPAGNSLLQYFSENNRGMHHAVIIGSEALYEHVRKNYPTLRTVSSILRITCDGGRGKADAYRALAERYDKVMVHPDDVMNFALLEQLENKDQYELIINEYCMRNCPLRPFHYRTLSQQALDYLGHDDRDFQRALSRNGCRHYCGMLGDPKVDVVALSTPEIQRLYDMGFRRFKLQGRGNGNGALLFSDMMRLILGTDAEESTTAFTLAVDLLESFSPDPVLS